MFSADDIIEHAKIISKSEFGTQLNRANYVEQHTAVSKAVIALIAENWSKSKGKHLNTRCAYYFSAEYLVGRAVFNNLFNLKLLEGIQKLDGSGHLKINSMEDIEDAALGNGGLGRLAACLLDSAATLNLPVMGYGIRYKYGYFKQKIENGFQKELPDDWTRFGDPWSVRCENDKVKVQMGRQAVLAVPYDTPIIGYDTQNVVTLRLWKSEPVIPFDFELFDKQNYTAALKEKNKAEDISRVLYPNDSTNEGKFLRLKQQYFFSSASIQDIIRNYKCRHDDSFESFSQMCAIQLNDTHPVIAIIELIRILIDYEGLDFEKAFEVAQKTFSYTNHTAMQEELEKWELKIIRRISPRLVQIIKQIDLRLKKELKLKEVLPEMQQRMQIVQDKTVHMAYLACYASTYINGVAKTHTETLKNKVLADFYSVYPHRFQNKTNGVTQRRWLGVCNPQLSALITELLGSNEWLKDLSKLKALEKFVDNESVIKRFIDVKNIKHKDLCDYIMKKEGIVVSPLTMFDVQINGLHGHKRQLLNILAILEIYFEIKDGTIKNFAPTTFIFGAKAAPGCFRAKATIKLISEVAGLIDKDKAVKDTIKVIFVSDYNVSYAEKIIPATDVSQQISTSGTQASGTGNMKLMINGAVTIGTYDGANIEVFDKAGESNNYVFGATAEEIKVLKGDYSPNKIYEKNQKVKRVLDALIDGTLDDDSTGMFSELYNSLLKGASRHAPDIFFVLNDFDSYLETKIKVNTDYQNMISFAKKCWLNICNSGYFSSDRTVSEYAVEIWHIDSV